MNREVVKNLLNDRLCNSCKRGDVYVGNNTMCWLIVSGQMNGDDFTNPTTCDRYDKRRDKE